MAKIRKSTGRPFDEVTSQEAHNVRTKENRRSGGIKGAAKRGFDSLSAAGKKGNAARTLESRIAGGKKAAAKRSRESLAASGRKGGAARARRRIEQNIAENNDWQHNANDATSGNSTDSAEHDIA